MLKAILHSVLPLIYHSDTCPRVLYLPGSVSDQMSSLRRHDAKKDKAFCLSILAYLVCLWPNRYHVQTQHSSLTLETQACIEQSFLNTVWHTEYFWLNWNSSRVNNWCVVNEFKNECSPHFWTYFWVRGDPCYIRNAIFLHSEIANVREIVVGGVASWRLVKQLDSVAYSSAYVQY